MEMSDLDDEYLDEEELPQDFFQKDQLPSVTYRDALSAQDENADECQNKARSDHPNQTEAHSRLFVPVNIALRDHNLRYQFPSDYPISAHSIANAVSSPGQDLSVRARGYSHRPPEEQGPVPKNLTGGGRAARQSPPQAQPSNGLSAAEPVSAMAAALGHQTERWLAAGELARQRKRAAIQRSEWAEKYRQFGHRVAGMEKERKMSSLFNPKSDMFKDTEAIQEAGHKDSEERNIEGRQLRQQVQSIRQHVLDVQRCIDENGIGQDYIDRLRSLLDTAEFGILRFKERQCERVEFLERESQLLHKELAAAEKRMDQWGRQREPTAPETSDAGTSAAHARERTSARSATPLRDLRDDSSLPPEVQSFERWVAANGGATGGWDEQDHKHFLKLKTRYAGNSKLFWAHAEKEIAGHDLLSVEEHDAWYQRYLQLLDQKKLAIHKWKAAKQKEKEDRLLRHVGMEEVRNAQEAEQGREQRQAAEKEEMLNKLAEFKLRKLEEKREAAREAERKLEARRKQEQAAAAERERMKEQVKQFQKAKKRPVEPTVVDNKHVARLNTPSADDLKRIAERNAQILEKKLKLRQDCERERAEHEAKMAKLREMLTPRVDRDPDRVTRPTDAFEHHIAPDSEPSATTKRPQSAYILDPALSRRATPSWRAPP